MINPSRRLQLRAMVAVAAAILAGCSASSGGQSTGSSGSSTGAASSSTASGSTSGSTGLSSASTSSGSTGATGTSGSSGGYGCSEDEMQPDGGAPIPCISDRDCPAGYLCDSNLTQRCVFQCAAASDCTSATAPADIRASCEGASGGCHCNFQASSGLSVCAPAVCTSDADCGCLHCTGGTCE